MSSPTPRQLAAFLKFLKADKEYVKNMKETIAWEIKQNPHSDPAEIKKAQWRIWPLEEWAAAGNSSFRDEIMRIRSEIAAAPPAPKAKAAAVKATKTKAKIAAAVVEVKQDVARLSERVRTATAGSATPSRTEIKSVKAAARDVEAEAREISREIAAYRADRRISAEKKRNCPKGLRKQRKSGDCKVPCRRPLRRTKSGGCK